MVSTTKKKSGGVAFLSPLRSPFSMDLLEAAPAFVLCSELGRSNFRDIDLLALKGNQSVVCCSELGGVPFCRNQSVPYCLSIV